MTLSQHQQRCGQNTMASHVETHSPLLKFQMQTDVAWLTVHINKLNPIYHIIWHYSQYRSSRVCRDRQYWSLTHALYVYVGKFVLITTGEHQYKNHWWDTYIHTNIALYLKSLLPKDLSTHLTISLSHYTMRLQYRMSYIVSYYNEITVAHFHYKCLDHILSYYVITLFNWLFDNWLAVNKDTGHKANTGDYTFLSYR